MKIAAIDLVGFGRLRDRQLTFGPGLNLIHGPNEAGKSTLLEALLALLFGFADEPTRPGVAAHNKLRERFQPWDGGPYAGSLRVALDNGEQYRLVRDFAQDTHRIYREPGATDVTGDHLAERRGWLTFASRCLGLPRSVFRACAWIDQAAMAIAGNDATSIKNQLAQLADSGSAETTAQDGGEQLDRWLREQVNPRATVVRNSPLLQAREAVGQLEGELEASRRALAALESLAAQEQALQQRRAELTGEQQALTAQLAARELADLEARQQRLAEIEREQVDAEKELAALADVADLTAAQLDEAREALGQIAHLRPDLAAADALVERERPAEQQARQRLSEIQAQLEQLPLVEEPAIAAAQDAVRAWEQAQTVAANAATWVDQLKADLARLARRDDPALAAVPQTTTADGLREAAGAIGDAERRVADARTELARVALTANEEAECARLADRLEDLRPEWIEQLQTIEQKLAVADASAKGQTAGPRLIVGLLVALIGLAVGAVALAVAGAVVGALVGGALGYLLAGLVLRPAEDAVIVAKNRALLRAAFDQYGVTSVGELRGLWDRYQALLPRAEAAHGCHQRLEGCEAALVAARAALLAVAGTADPVAARAVERKLSERDIERTARLRDLARAEGEQARCEAPVPAVRAAVATALQALGGLGREPAVATPAEAQARLEAVQANQLLRVKLLGDGTAWRGKLDQYAEHAAARQRLADQLVLAEATAHRGLAAVGVPAASGDPVDALKLRRERFEAYQAALGKRKDAAVARRTLLGESDPTAWAARCADLRPLTAGADPDDPRDRPALESARDEVQRKFTDTTGALGALQGKRETRWENQRLPSVIEEDLVVARRQRNALERLGRALESARSLLSHVATEYRRDFAPRLSDGVAQTLGEITGGRYVEVQVDPESLAVRARLAGQPGLVDLDRLSHGTRDAIALLLRTGVADLLGNGGERAPLFLDDPLVHVDPERTRALLAALGALAQQRQLFYFTQDPRLIDWVPECAGADCAVHYL